MPIRMTAPRAITPLYAGLSASKRLAFRTSTLPTA
jgi:hypothetical protein